MRAAATAVETRLSSAPLRPSPRSPPIFFDFSLVEPQLPNQPVFSERRRQRTAHRYRSAGRTSVPLNDAIGSNSMSQKKPTNPITAAIAGGLMTGLASISIGSRLWPELDGSQSLTMLVIGVGVVVGAAVTFAIVRRNPA